jgi:hypothetical protein
VCSTSKITIEQATWPDIRRVAANMRAEHRRSACALAGTADPLEAIQALEHLPYVVGVTIWQDDEPIVACGAVLEPQCEAATFLFATDRWPEVPVETVRVVRNLLRQALAAAGVRRIKTVVMTGDIIAERWPEFLESYLGGNNSAGPAVVFRQNGEEFLQFICHLKPATRGASSHV